MKLKTKVKHEGKGHMTCTYVFKDEKHVKLENNNDQAIKITAEFLSKYTL